MSRFDGRGLDWLWFWWCVIHIPITLAVDMQPLYPASLLANTPLPAFLQWWLSISRDPILLGAFGGKREWHWLSCFLALEGGVQLPCFILGAWGLWRNDKRIYPLMLFYGASTATTVVPCLYYLFTDTASVPPLTTPQVFNLAATYVPFLLLPLTMAVDMGFKIIKMIDIAEGRKRV